MNLKDATVVLDGVFRHIPQKAIGIILQFSSVRRISFTTPPDRRAALVEQAKALYSEFSGAPDGKDLDRINRMDRINSTTNPVNPVNPVQTAASLSAAPDSQKILEFIGVRLSAAPEESDVVHDLLAYLAEQMIDMNKKKNTEIKIVEESISGGKDAKETEIAG